MLNELTDNLEQIQWPTMTHGHHRFQIQIRSSHSKWYIRDDRWCLPKFWTWSASCDFHLKNCSKNIARSRILLVIFGNFMPNGSSYGVGMKYVDIWLSLKLSMISQTSIVLTCWILTSNRHILLLKVSFLTRFDNLKSNFANSFWFHYFYSTLCLISKQTSEQE